MTAVITLITISGPVTVLALGWLLESLDVRTVILGLAIGRLVMAVAFAMSCRGARGTCCRLPQGRL